MGQVVLVAQVVVVMFFLTMSGLQLIIMISAGRELTATLRRPATGHVLKSSFSPRVSLLVPAYNEAAMVADTVASMLAINYPKLEVVVVNDGSTDDTLAALIDRFELVPTRALDPGPLTTQDVTDVYRSPDHPGLLVVDKENGGKSDALNAALVRASGDLVCAVDADTIIEPDALKRLVIPFVQDDSLLAAGGSVRPLNGCRIQQGRVVERGSPTGFLAGIQGVEYARAFLFGRLGWNRLGGNVIVSGAFGLFNRVEVISAGGYLESTVGEDMELILRLRKNAVDNGRGNAVSFMADPMAWTEVPESYRTLARQRNRWQRGLLDALLRHRRAIGRPRYGLMGVVVLPFYLMELLAPLFETAGVVLALFSLGAAIPRSTIGVTLFLVTAYLFPAILSSVAMSFQDLLDGSQLAPRQHRRRARWILLEQLGYHQLTVVWRLWGFASALRGDTRWGAQIRRGLGDTEPGG